MGRRAALRTIAGLLLAATAVATFVGLGFWQLDRHEQLGRRNALLTARLQAEPLPFDQLTVGLDPSAPAGAASDGRFRPVQATGRFLPEHEVLLRGRELDGQPGHHVLTPLLLEAGAEPRAVLVDRGWVPYRVNDPDVPSFAPPQGTVRIVGRLMPEEDAPTGLAASLAPRDPPEGRLETVARADVQRLQQQVPVRLEPWWIELASYQAFPPNGPESVEVTQVEGELPIVPPPPRPERGPHLSYALQWFFFAAVTVVGSIALLRRAVQSGRADRGHGL